MTDKTVNKKCRNTCSKIINTGFHLQRYAYKRYIFTKSRTAE